jgi:hypothetical protein
MYTKCTTNVQHSFTWGGFHSIWSPPHVKGCCKFVVGMMYNYHYSTIPKPEASETESEDAEASDSRPYSP